MCNAVAELECFGKAASRRRQTLASPARFKSRPEGDAGPPLPSARHRIIVCDMVMHRPHGGRAILDIQKLALLTDVPAQRLARGQVGTIVEHLDDKTVLVEFSDDQGRAYAIAACQSEGLLVLHYVPEPA